MFGCRAHHPRRFIQRYLYILAPVWPSYAKSIIHAIWVAPGRELYRNNDVQESTVCTYVRSGVVLTTPDVLFQDTYIFLLQHVRATRKVSYMLYKVHWWESCTVTTTFKKVLNVCCHHNVCTFGCRAHHPRRFIPRYLYILAPICQGYSKSIIYAI